MLYVLFTIPTIFQCMFFAFLEVYEEDIYGKGNSNIMTDITNMWALQPKQFFWNNAWLYVFYYL